jgi:hypothetical protein
MGEPILWAHKAAPGRTQLARRWNAETSEWEVIYNESTGLPLREKVPQRGHEDGDYDAPKLATGIRRWMHVLRHEGNVVRAILNMGAADTEGADFIGKVVRGKARTLGWIPVGRCPVAMRMAGQIRPHQLADTTLRTLEKGCERSSEERPCPHYFMEEKARKARHARAQAEIAAQYKSDADKLIASQKQATTDIVTGVAGVLADAIKSVVQPPPPALPPAPPPDEPPPAESGKKGRG